MALARRRAGSKREEILTAAHRQASESVGAARQESKSKLEKAREGAAKEAELELAGLRGQVGAVAALLVERLTKTRVGL